MALRDIHLSTRITAAALIAVVFGAFALLIIEESRLQGDYLNERRAQVKQSLTSEELRLRQAVETLRRDALFLSNTPPIMGIVRASRNGGVDPREGNSNVVWKRRLQEIFGAFIQAHPEYYKIRYIGATDGDGEFVRVQMGDNSKIEVTPDAGLKPKAGQNDYKLGMTLAAGQVAISQFSRDSEQVTAAVSRSPTLRAIVPIFDEQGRRFGLVVTHMNMGGLLAMSAQEMPFGARTYIANMSGGYLLYPDAGWRFNLEQAGKGGMATDFPATAILFGKNTPDELQLQQYSLGRTHQYLAAKRIHFDSAQPTRFLVLVYQLPANLIETGISAIPTQHIINGLLLTLLVAGMVFFVLRRLFAPLDQLTAVANSIAGGSYDFELPPKTGGEIGLLVSAIDSMLSRLWQREQEVLQLNTNLEDRVEQRTDELMVINARLSEEIDKRARAEEALQQENAFRKNLIESLPGIFYMFDSNGQFLIWNRNLCDVLGMTDQEIASAHPLDLFRDNERALIEQRIAETFEHGETSVEATLIAKDGNGTPFLFTGKRIYRGGIMLLIGMGQDITEQREILRVTSKLLRRNQTLMKNSMEGIYVLDADGDVVEANDAFCRMLGYTPSEMSQLNVADWNVQWSAAELRAKIGELVGNSAVLETVQRCKDGHQIEVELCMTGIDLEGESYLFVASRDITERQKMQAVLQRHHQMIETAMDGFWMTDANGVLEEVNEAYVWLSGYTRNELIGMHISELEANERPADVEAHIKKIFEQGQDRFETRHRRKNGEVYDIEISVTFMEKCRKLFVFAHDITQRKRASLALQHNQELLNEAQRLGKLGSWEMICKTGELHWSEEVYRIFQIDPSQTAISHDLFMSFVHPRDRGMVDKAYEQSLLEHRPYDIEHRLLLPDGNLKWVREHCITEFDAAGAPVRSVGMVQDITEQKKTQEALRVAAATFESHDAILITDARSRIVNVNRAFTEVTGYSLEEVVGKNPRIMSSGRHDHNFYIEMWQQLKHAGSWSGEIWDKRKDGDIYPKWMTITAVKNERDEITQYVAIFSDITERKRAEEEIRVLAFYDPLTRLPNRRLFLDRLRVSLPASARHKNYGAVLFLDMDRFKTLNDTLGHEFGDLMLVEVAQRLKSCVREMDTVARLGGDEFVVLLEGVDDEAQNAAHKVGVVAEKIRASLANPYQLKEHEHHSSPSVGVTLFHGTENSADDLLRRADLAMYQAKSNGRNAVRFFDPAMQANVEQHEAIEKDLRHAAERGELHLHYQLQVDNALHTVGAEALIRWQHPRRGMVSPGQFIPIAEESSLILDIGHWVLETACRQLACWQEDETMRHLSLAVNISARQFRRDDLVEIVAALLVEHGIKPALLKLELTESVVLGDVADVVEKMHALKALGIHLSLDDFGTGYSSLSYLKRLPLDQIKIDQSFVRDIVSDPTDAVMVKTIIDMATNFRLNVIAEGVETEAQFAVLKQHNCMAYQGYLFSKPIPLPEFEVLVRQKI